MHACIHKVQLIKGSKVPKKITILSDSGNVGLRVCSFMITHAQCFMLIVVCKVIYVVIA